VPWGEQDLSSKQAEIDATALPPPVDAYNGPIEIEAFVIRHGRDGSARSGTVLARNPRGARVLASMEAEADELARLEELEIVGTRWSCRHDGASGKNLARPA
jgi:acetyl-CoA C-acetyltransferase